MRYLAYGYALFFIGWSVFELRDLRRLRYPRWLLGIEVSSKLLLVAGMLLNFIEHGVVGPLQSSWRMAIFPIVGLEFMLRVLAIRNEEQDLELSASANRLVEQVTVPLTGLIIGPAAYMGFRFAYPEGSSSAFAVLMVAVAIGFGLAFCWPRLSGCFKSTSERKMVEWLESSEPFRRPPDEIELFDNSMQQWPGFEKEIRCQLFRIRYGEHWYVGLTGPATQCLTMPAVRDSSAADVYEAYKEWFADHVSRMLLREAAQDFPEDFRKIVEEALIEGAVPKDNESPE